MPNGKVHDHPVTDTVVHGLHPFPKKLELLVVEVHTHNPGVFDDLELAPFDWEKGKYVAEAMELLQGLIKDHGDPLTCRRLVEEYRASTRAAGRPA